MEFRYYQNDAINSIFNYYTVPREQGKGNPIVAMPTGTGKSVVIGGFAQRVINFKPSARLMMATHVKELVEQNANKLDDIMPGADYGIYSAGLKQKDTQQRIIYGGVASMVKQPGLFGFRDFLLVDECHLIGKAESAQYQTLIHGLRQVNPWLRVVGFTATGYRMGMGYLTNGDIFTDFCYDITGMDAFNRLIEEGYLAPLIPLRSDIFIDTQGVKTVQGEFDQKQSEDRARRITSQALNEASKFRFHRHSWLVFASSVKHAYEVCQMLNFMGIKSTVVHSNSKEFPLTDDERDKRIRGFKAGEYQCIVNYNILTTGFDCPQIDLIMILRLTKSVPLWVQMLGRGTRPFSGNWLFPRKLNCLCLDYARNTARLGPVNDPVIPRPKGQGAGDAPIKICEECGTYNHISARHCIGCGEPFTFQVKIVAKASDAELIRNDNLLPPPEPIIDRYTVNMVKYHPYTSKRSGLRSFRVAYSVKEWLLPFYEYVSIEGQPKARAHAVDWWMQRTPEPCPLTITEACEQASRLRVPSHIMVHSNAPEGAKIIGVEYDNAIHDTAA